MTYKEKLKAFENGTLSETESKEIESDIDKFEALLDFFNESTTPAEINNESTITFSNEINKIINKKISKNIIKTILTVLLFAFLFVFGLSTVYIAQKFNSSDMAEYIISGIYSLVFIPTVVTMMYRMFAKKEKAPAIILLIWNIVPTVLTFVLSSIFGDAVAVLLPAFYGFSVLPNMLGSLFSIDIGGICGISGMVISVVLSVIALIIRNKQIIYKTISKKLSSALLAVFLIFNIALIGFGTADQINKGYFTDSKICLEKTAETVKGVSGDIFTSDVLGMTTKETEKLYTDCGFTKSEYNENNKKYNIFEKKSSNVMHIETTDKNGKTNSATYSSGYQCRYLYISIENIEKISTEYMGKTEKETIKYLSSVNCLPNYVNYYYNDKGVKCAEYFFHIDIPASEYNFRYIDNITITFENGIMTNYSNDK